jgi:short-subunit dehydrogenase
MSEMEAQRDATRVAPAKGWSYRGRWALVTGASSGIGEEFARELARRGMNLVLAARRIDRLSALAIELERAHGIEADALIADLATPGAAAELWRDGCEGREMALVVNNAGYGLKGRFDELPLDRQTEMVHLNCIAVLELSHLALTAMRPRGSGAIVNVASIAAYQPIPMLATYAASKAFVVTLTEALAEEARGSGVRVVTLNPGPVATEFQSVAGTQVNRGTLGIRTPAQVVADALDGLEHGKRTVTPGFINRVSTYAVRVLPRGPVIRMAKAVMTKLR